MSVLLVTENFPPKTGGTARLFGEIYGRLAKGEAFVVAGDDDLAGPFDDGQDLEITRVPLTFPTRFVRRSSLEPYRAAYRKLLEAVRSSGVNQIHAGRAIPEGLLALMVRIRTGVPYVCWTHGEDVNFSNSDRRPSCLRRRLYSSRELAQLVGLVLRGARRVIANSPNTRDILAERWGLDSGKVSLIHPGVDTRQFKPAPPSPVTRDRLQWSGRPVILTVGRLQRRKGQDTVIRALGAIRRSIPDVLYAIVGDGEDLERLEGLVRTEGQEDHVLFMGEVEDRVLVECYQQCDVFVLANRDIEGDIEGFGMVLLEAQACGKPVVAGNSGGTSETMLAGESGVLVACDRPEDVAVVVTGLLGDDAGRDAMGRRARELMESRFDWGAVVRKAATVFGEIEKAS